MQNRNHRSYIDIFYLSRIQVTGTVTELYRSENVCDKLSVAASKLEHKVH